MHVARRKLVLASTAVGLLPLVSRVSAQKRDPAIEKQLATNTAQAMELQLKVQATGFEMSVVSGAPLLKSEASLRLDLWKILRQVPTAQLVDYVRPDGQALASLMRTENVALLPDQAAIVPFNLQALPAPAKCAETTTAVLIDIVSQFFGYELLKEALTAAVAQTPELEARFERLATAIGARNAKQVIDAITALLDFLARFAQYEWAIKAIGAQRATLLRRKMLEIFGLRFVPIVGWVYTAITLAVIIFSNSARLLATVNCSRK